MNALEAKERLQEAANEQARAQAAAVLSKVQELVEVDKIRNPVPMKLNLTPAAFRHTVIKFRG